MPASASSLFICSFICSMAPISSTTIWAVSAFSVVLMAHTCIWWYSFTPGTESMHFATLSRFTFPGTPSIASLMLFESRLHVEITITMAISSPITGSMILQPVYFIMIPETTTLMETSVSAAICRKAPFILRSFSLSFMKSHAVIPFIAIPMAATQIMVSPKVEESTGWMILYMLSLIMNITATISNMALVRLTRIVPFL